jgi:nucleotide-binding universal stress UspA family protein
MGNEHSLVKRILFATDFSSCANHAEKYVAVLAKAYGAAIDVVHVLEIYPGMYSAVQDPRETVERVAEAVRRLQQPTAPVTGQQRPGIASVVICEAAMEHHADLIVLGTHGRTGLEHILLGSTAERVLTIAPCPVLTVRVPKGSEARHTRAPIKLEHVVVPIDFSGCSLDALEYGIQIAKDFRASLTLLHVLEPVPYGIDLTLGHVAERDQEWVNRQLKSLASTIGSYGVSVSTEIHGGLPADSIVEFVRASDYGLLVMGTHGRRGISHVMMGSVAEAVLRRAPWPVLVLKSAKFAPGHQRVMRMETEPMTRPT